MTQPGWLTVTLPDGRHCLLRPEPDPEAVLGIHDDFVPGMSAMRVVVIVDVDAGARATHHVVQFRQGWEAQVPEGLAPIIRAIAVGHE